MRVLLACDQKWRDLPSLVVIKVHLERLGHKVSIIPPKEMEPLIAVLQPDLVMLNHFWDERYRQLARQLRAHGIAVGVLPTEGAIPTSIWGPMVFGKFTDYSLVDLYLSWNAVTADGIASAGKLSAKNIRVVGCPRFDFAVQPLLQSCMSRDELCKRLSLDPLRPIVTWASRFALAKMSYAREEAFQTLERNLKEIGYWQSIEGNGHNIKDLISIFKNSLDAFLDAFIEIARRHSEMQFVFKPHPADDVEYIKKRIELLRLPNVRLSIGAYIADVLRASDVLVNSNCTTSIEAWTMHVPVIDAQLVPDPISGRPDIQAGNCVGRSVDEIDEILVRLIADPNPGESIREVREALIAKWFDKIDGQRCAAVAMNIDDFLRARDKSRKRWYPIRLAGGVRRVVASTLVFWRGAPVGTSAINSLLKKPATLVRGGVFDKLITQHDVLETQSKLLPLIAR